MERGSPYRRSSGMRKPSRPQNGHARRDPPVNTEAGCDVAAQPGDSHCWRGLGRCRDTAYRGKESPLGWWDSGLGTGLTPQQLVLVGTRSIDDAEQELIEHHQIPVLIPAKSKGTTLNKIVAGRPVYFHIDCDVLEPGLFQTDYREPDGLTLTQLEGRASALALSSTIVGVEIAE